MTITAANITKAGYYDSVAGKVHAGTRMTFGHNTGRHAGFYNGAPFVNQFKTAGRPYNWNTAQSNGATMDSNGYVDMTVPSTGKISYVTHTDYIQIGTYVLTWVGTGEIQWSGGTETDDSINNVGSAYYPTVNRKEYSITSTSTGNVEVNWTDDIATDIKLFLKSEETEIDAGQVTSPTWLTDVAGIQILRVMPMQATYLTPIQDAADFTPFSYSTWGKKKDNGVHAYADDVPLQALATMCNEIDCDIMLSVPHQATNACIDAMATELDTYLDAGRLVYVEYTNEGWNAIFPQGNYIRYFDAADHDCTVVPATATASEVGHGLVTGDEILCVMNGVHLVWPYYGGTRWVIRDDDDTFRFASSEANAIADTDVGAIDNEVTAVRYKLKSDSADQYSQNYVDRATQCWDRFVTVFGASRIKKVAAGQSANSGVCNGIYNISGAREDIDYFAIAPYSEFTALADFDTYTNADLTDYMINTVLPTTKASAIAAHLAITGTYNLMCYESGDHNTDNGNSFTSAQDAKVLDWARSFEAQRFYTYYYKWLASQGISICFNFDSHRIYSTGGDGTWGVMEHIGDTDAAQYLGIKDFLDAGLGVPKL